jgi:hypothetical protein
VLVGGAALELGVVAAVGGGVVAVLELDGIVAVAELPPDDAAIVADPFGAVLLEPAAAGALGLPARGVVPGLAAPAAPVDESLPPQAATSSTDEATHTQPRLAH